MENKYKSDLISAVFHLYDTIEWLDNNEGNEQDEEDKENTRYCKELLLEFIDKRL